MLHLYNIHQQILVYFLLCQVQFFAFNSVGLPIFPQFVHLSKSHLNRYPIETWLLYSSSVLSEIFFSFLFLCFPFKLTVYFIFAPLHIFWLSAMRMLVTFWATIKAFFPSKWTSLIIICQLNLLLNPAKKNLHCLAFLSKNISSNIFFWIFINSIISLFKSSMFLYRDGIQRTK